MLRLWRSADKKNPRQNFEFAVCQPTAHGKTGDPLRFQKICRVPNVCRVFCPLAHGKDVNPLRFENFCRVVIVCRVSRSAAHGKRVLCRVHAICRELHLRHTAKGSFAVCLSFGSRQTIGHTANIQFLVVNPALKVQDHLYTSQLSTIYDYILIS